MDETLFAAVDAYCMTPTSHPPSATSDSFNFVIDSVPGKVPFGELIKEMGAYLTNADGIVRRRGTYLLASILEAHIASEHPQMVSMLQKEDAFRTIVGFFCGRLADYPSVIPCLKALKALLEFSLRQRNVYPTVSVHVSKALFAELHVQAMEQPTRQAVYEILLHIVSNSGHVAALTGKVVGGFVGDAPYALEFAVGFVQAFDGEKDPRCLLIALQIARILLSDEEADDEDVDEDQQRLAELVSSYTQEIFDVTACYFPITFTPPPNDPHGITKEALVMALRRVFTASSRLAALVVPLCLEKLSSTVVDAKRDAMQTIAFSAEKYGVVVLSPFLAQLCDALREEVVQSHDTPEPPALRSSSVFFGLWTGASRVGPAAKLIGLTAGALGMNFTGKTEVFVNGGYGLYIPPQILTDTASTFVPELQAANTQRMPTLADEALSTIAELTRIISLYVQSTAEVDEWHTFVSTLLRFSISEIARAPESITGHAAARILCAISSASHHALASVLESIMPVIYRVYDDAMQNHRVAVRAAVVTLVAGLLHTIDHGVDHPAGGHPVSKHTASIFDLLLSTLATPLVQGDGGADLKVSPVNAASVTDSEARCIAAAGLCDLAVRPPSALLTIEQKISTVEKFTYIILSDADDLVREACLRAVCTMASVRHRFCQAVLHAAVPRLFAVVRKAMTFDASDVPATVAETAAALYSDLFTDLHLPGVGTAVSRALYALGQLACISNLRVQNSIVPQLLDMCIHVRPSERTHEPVFALRETNGSTAVSVAVVETLGRLVATKACVNDPDAMDAFVDPCEDADDQHVNSRTPSVHTGDDASSVNSWTTGSTDTEHRLDDGFARGMSSLLHAPESSVLHAEEDETSISGEGCHLSLVSALYNLLVDSIHARAHAASGVEDELDGALSLRVRGTIELVFRTIAIRASAAVQDRMRAWVTDVLLQGIEPPESPKLHGAKDYPWFTPLVPTAPVVQIQVLPCLLKVLACSRKGAPVPRFRAIVDALCKSVLHNPCETVDACDDPQQRFSARTIIELCRRTAGKDPRALDEHIDEELALDVGTAGVSAAARSLAVTHELSNEGTRLRSASGRLQLELQRAAIVSSQVIGVCFNRAPSSASGKAEYDAILQSVLQVVVQSSAVGRDSFPHGLPPDAIPSVPEEAVVLKSLVLVVWLLKGLALRGHPAAHILATTLVNVIAAGDAALPSTSQRLQLASQGLGCVLADPAPKHPFHKDSGAVVLPLFKQKLFSFVYSRYSRIQQSKSDGTHQLASMTLSLTLCNMASHLPQSLLLAEIEKVLPIVVRTLDMCKPSNEALTGPFEAIGPAVASAALACLRTIIKNAPTSLSTHVHTVVSSLLSFAQDGLRGRTKLIVRAAAVDCLRDLTSLPYHKLHPYKRQVVDGLLPVLDDPKRTVRRRAAACRNDWLTLGPSSAAATLH